MNAARAHSSTLARAAALLVGLALLLNALGGLLFPRFDATIWLVDLRALPSAAQLVLSFLWAATFIARAWRPPSPALRFGMATFAAVAAVNSVNYYKLLASGAFTTHLPVPLSLLLIFSFIAMMLPEASRPARALHMPVAAIALAPICLVLQMLFFGSTDYRRPADVILVFGARVYADGSPSLAAADRVATAAALYHQGLAPTLILSGGPGDGPTTEAAGMKHLAMSLGVPESAIVLDDAGLNTIASVRNITPDAKGHLPRVLAVSHAYHLPRIKLALDRAGIPATTVPVLESRHLLRKPLFIAREAAALVKYYFTT